jgi:HPt (histidine-containing phosphotransfer) domain-containing protein
MSEAPICNKACYFTFCTDIGADDAAEVLSAFLDNTTVKVGALASLRDRQEIKREAHSIKSSSATFGFVRLSELGRELEVGVETARPADLQNMIAAIQETFRATASFARRELLGAGLTAA